MLVFPVSASSVLFFFSMISAVFVGVFFAFIRRELSLGPSFLMAAALAIAPQLRELSSMVMADTLHALLCMCAMFALNAYLDKPERLLLVTASLATALAFLTRNNAVLLAIAIPLTIVLSRAWWIFRQRVVWVAAGAVLVLVGGWELWARRWVRPL
jgi:hypothetical protein